MGALKKQSIFNESDVEQKLIYKLLVDPPPSGLGYSNEDILTKPDIRALTIDKGSSRKRYHPDYAIISNGLPSLIIEAKHPKESLESAEHEARLYATELNAQFPSKLNPCNWYMVSNGNEAKLFEWDSDKPLLELSFDDINALSPKLEELVSIVSRHQIAEYTKTIKNKISGNPTFIKPVHLLGGKSLIKQSVGENAFGANVSLEYKYLFNPETMEDREAIVKNAYIASKRRESHISPIDKLIRAAIPRSEVDAAVIENSKKPQIIIDKLSDNSRIANEICLLIGGVGTGKSTFTDYLRTIGLPEKIKESTEWLNINLNKAPLDKNKIYEWVLDQIILSIRAQNKATDFDDIKTLQDLYSEELDRLKRGRASLLQADSTKYNEVIYEELCKLQESKEVTLSAYIRLLYQKVGKLPVIVLDNCDKRNRDDQLLMFEVATWLKDSFYCMVFLPIRDTTYEQYCNTPPLDTVIKDLVFRVDPPLLEKVIYSRLKYAIRNIEHETKDFHYHLSNGMKVTCKRSEVITYLSCIVSSLFQDQYFRRIIVGLAGRNIRKGLEIFLDFCKSGHISEEMIFKIRQSSGEFTIPSHLVAKIVLKGNLQYYSEANSHIKNMFHSESSDDFNDPFVRIAILKWLQQRFRSFGPSKMKGFHQIGDLVQDIQKLGHSGDTAYREMAALTQAGCIITESQTDEINAEDLVSITPSGFVHLGLLKNINYLSIISEDTWFRENQIALKIKDNITGSGLFKKESKQSALSNSQILIEYMKSYYENFFIDGSRISVSKDDDFYRIRELSDYVESRSKSDVHFNQINFLQQMYPTGIEVMALVVSIQDYGFFVEFDTEGSGLIHKSNIAGNYQDTLEVLEEGAWVIAKILEYSPTHGRFKLELIET